MADDQQVEALEIDGNQENIQDPFKPELFEPHIINENNNLPEAVKKNKCNQIWSKMYKLGSATAIRIFLYTFIFIAQRHVSLITIFGIALFLIYLSYGIALYGTLGISACKGRNLYRIYTFTSEPPNWINTGIIAEQYLFKQQSFLSISEFSAIGGSFLTDMLDIVGAYTWCIVLAGLAVKFQFYDLSWGVDDVFVVLGSWGLLALGLCDLDPFNTALMTIHRITSLLTLLNFAAYTIQQYQMSKLPGNTFKRLISAIILDVIGIFGVIIWNVFKKKAKDDNKKGGKLVHIVTKNSIICVITEGIFLYASGFSLSLWFIFVPYNCNGIDCLVDSNAK